MHKVMAENRVQAEAFRRMAGNELELIPIYAADFRQIINEYERSHHGRIPSADDLICIASQQRGRDITK